MTIITLTAVFLAFALPVLLWALDINGDNLDDTWETQYGITTNAYASTNLVGWWQLNGTNSTDNATDRSGNAINGTLSGFPSVAYGPGLFSNALYFTTNGTVTFPTTNNALNATNQFTFSAWFRTTNTVSQPATIATWRDAATNGWSVGSTTNGVPNITFFDGGTQQVVAGTTNVNLYDGNWHQMAATYATNQVATVYVDGTGQATNTITGWTPEMVSSFSFGVPNSSTTNHPYILDETRLYNRALGASEINQLPVTYTDLNGSGLSIYQDYLESLNPLLSGTIVTSGFISSGLTGYYGSSAPTLTKTGGDNQIVSASTFETNALVVHVTNGATALVGAPITFTIPSGSDGGVALTSGGTITTSLSLTTDGSGNATVYYQSGSDSLKNNTITATAVYTTGSVSVSFTAYCGIQSGLQLWLRADQGVTLSSGKVSQIQDQSVNNLSLTQSTSTKQPVVQTDSVLGNSTLRFNGGQYLTTSSNLGVDPNITIVMVATVDTPSSSTEQVACCAGLTTTAGTMRGYGYRSSQPVCDVYLSSLQTATSPLGGQQVITTMTYTRGSNAGAFYCSGSANGTGTVSSTTTASGFIIGGPGWLSNLWTGTISEILVYNSVLTSTQQQQVEVYLANKYGLYHPNATWPSAYSSAVQSEITRNKWNQAQANAYVAFLVTNPAVPPRGLVTWLKADAGVTSSSSKVSQWADQGPSGNTAVQSSGTHQPTLVSSAINGEPALSFDGSTSYMTIPDNASLRPSNITILAVASRTGGTDYGRLISKPYYSTSGVWNSPYVAYELTRDPNTEPYVSSTVSGTGHAVGNGQRMNNMQPYLFSGTYDGATLSFYQNGTSAYSTSASGPIDNGDGTRKDLVIGSSSTAWLNQSFPGQVAEILIYNRALTDSERQDAEVYLANKYGLYHPYATWWQSYSAQVQTEIQRFQWNKAQADAYVTFLGTNPAVPVSGLAAWYRADAGVTTDGSGNVSLWSDQSVNHNDASQATSGTRPALVSSSLNGKPVLRFTSAGKWLAAVDNSTLRNSATTLIGVYRPNTLSSSYQALLCKPYRAGSFTSPWQTYILAINSSNHPFMDTTCTGGTFNDITSATTVSTGTAYLLMGIYGNGNEQFYVNGGSQGSSAIANNPLYYNDSTEKDLAIGTNSSTAPGSPCQGDLAEILIYDHALSSVEQAQVGVYLANKYGLSFTSPAPVMTPNGGSYLSSVSVSFTSVTSPEVIKYTLDGTAPTINSTTYSSAFTLTQSCPVNAAIFSSSSGVQISPVSSAQFYVGDTGSIGISDAWQTTYFGHTGISPNAQSPGGSGLTNLQAYLYGYNPNLFSTNGDGLSDLVNHQLGIAGSNTTISGDGLTNAQNLALGIDPFNTNEAPITPPATNPSDHTAPTINLNQPANATLLP